MKTKRVTNKRIFPLCNPLLQKVLFIGKKSEGREQRLEKGKSLLLDLNNLLPPKSVNSSAW